MNRRPRRSLDVLVGQVADELFDHTACTLDFLRGTEYQRGSIGNSSEPCTNALHEGQVIIIGQGGDCSERPVGPALRS